MNTTIPLLQRPPPRRGAVGADSERIATAIAANPILSKLQPSSKLRLSAGTRVERVGCGEVICHADASAVWSWLVLSGEVKLVKYTTRGATLLIDLVLPNHLLGAVFYRCHPVYPCTAVAMRETEVAAFKTTDLLAELEENPPLQRLVLDELCLKLCRSYEMRGLFLERAPVRIAALLLYLQGKFGPLIPETRETIAELAGTTLETAMRVSSQMARSGILRTGRGRIEIVSLAKLEAWARGEKPGLL